MILPLCFGCWATLDDDQATEGTPGEGPEPCVRCGRPTERRSNIRIAPPAED